MIPERLVQHACCLCEEHGIRRLGISVPAIVVPIVGYPVPLYLRFRGALCHQHTAAFTIEKFTDHFGAWYDMAADDIRAQRKPAVNPFPKLIHVKAGEPVPDRYTLDGLPEFGLYRRQFDFDWEDFVVNPNFEPAPKDQCYLQFWEPQTLAAKGAKQELSRT